MPSIHIVAHSIGGIIGKAAYTTLLQKHKDLSITLIALSSPFSYIPYIYDTSILRFYDYYKINDSNITSTSNSSIISISAGVRDELIHPSWCELSQENENVNTISVRTNS